MFSQPVSRPAATILLAVVLAAPARGGDPATSGPTWEWTGVARVVAVGDVHGNHDKLVRLLQAADLLDEDLRWVGGDSHLVVAGDFLDRGLQGRALMDLLRRLEQESIAAGGRAHVLLGNHEVMNLMRDLRYVNPASYRDFAREERKADRRRATGQFAKLEGDGFGAASFRAFNDKFPPGYFARLRSMGPDGEYGSWLMSLPAMVKINGVVYAHGGLNERFAQLGVAGINRTITTEIGRYVDAREVLEASGVVSPVMNIVEVLHEAQKTAQRRGGRKAERQAAQQLVAAATHPILGAEGPLWYRGSALQDERLERDVLDRALELLDATALVVAHSPTTTHRITSRFYGKLFRIDHGIGESEQPLALVVEHGETLVLNGSTRETTSPVRELPLGQLGATRASELSDDQLAEFLARSPVIAARELGKGSTRPLLVVLEKEGEVRRGVFKTVEGASDRYQHEVAAYQLDRALGLGMVPVTVLRTLDGQTGSLQAWVDGALDLEAAEGYNLQFFDSEGKASQLALARVFDALIGNAGRKPADILGLVRREQVMLIDHSKAFSSSRELPVTLDGQLTIPSRLAAALEGLNRAALVARLGKLISGEQIDALLARRDRILAHRAVSLATSP